MASKPDNQFPQQERFFPKELSDQIIRTMMSPKEVDWGAKEILLDEIVPRVVGYGYKRVPGIRNRLESASLHPDQITDFQSYERLFPLTSITEMSDLGQAQFDLLYSTHSLRINSLDYEVLAEHVLVEKVGRKRRGVIKAKVTRADARAASLVLAGQLLLTGSQYDTVLINQKPGDNLLEDSLLKFAIVPAFQLLGFEPVRIMKSQDLERLSIGRRRLSMLLPPTRNQGIEISDLSLVDFIISTGGKLRFQNILYLGDYNPEYGLFPALGYRMPLPNLIRVIDADGRIPRNVNGEPETGQRGRLVIDRLCSAYELPTTWALLKVGLIQALDYLEVGNHHSVDLDALWSETIGDNYGFRYEFHTVAEETGLAGTERFPRRELRRLYSQTLRHYFDTSVRIGVPSSTWLLKVSFPVACKIESDGTFNSIIPLSNLAYTYIVGKELEVKNPPETTPYTSLNFIGRVSDKPGQPIAYPELTPSPISKRITNALNGRDLFGPNKDGYSLTASIVSPGDFDSMLRAARVYSQLKPEMELTFEDICQIMNRLHQIVEGDLGKALAGETSMISIFADKTRIPISEIGSMVVRVQVDLLDNGGRGLKRIAFAAMIDHRGDILSLTDGKLEKGIQALKNKRAVSPVFMVTPGNITLYDSFVLFGQFLLAKLSNQREQSLTIYIRPSESDITFNFLVYHFHAIVQEIDRNNKKGLRTMLQKAYWDPRYDEDFLRRAMGNAVAGIYYGTGKTYMEARFNAAMDKALEKGFPIEDVNAFAAIASEKKVKYHRRALELSQAAGVSPELIRFTEDVLSKHKIYPETLNAIVLLPDAEQIDLNKCAEGVLEQVFSLRGADCTNANKVWLHHSVYDEFMLAFEEKAARLTVGDVMNPGTRLAQYDTDYLKGTQSIVADDEFTRVIAPTDVNTGEKVPVPILPSENYTGVILTELEADMLLHGDPFDRETYVAHLAKELPLPWLNVILYDEVDEVLQTMEAVLEKYAQRSGYPRYLYVSAMGAEIVDDFEKIIQIRGIADLFKKGEEAYRQFTYYRPHQGGFFIHDLVE